jgi:hypothetical protein
MLSALKSPTIWVVQLPDQPRQLRQAAVNTMRALSHNSPKLCLLPIMRARLAIMPGFIDPL